MNIADSIYCVGRGLAAIRGDGRQTDTEFLFHALAHLKPTIYGIALAGGSTFPNISKANLETLELSLPPLSEQRQIARLLSAVQRAIQRQEHLIALTAELKKALMHKLFTEGTCGEPLKQTEIGQMPKSWRTEPLDQHLSAAQYGLSVKGSDDGKTPILRMTNQVDGRVVDNDLQTVNIGDDDCAKFKVEPLDILFNRTNSFELVGRTAIFDLRGEYVFASYLIRLRTCPDTLRARFLNHYLNWGATQARLKGIASRAVSQSNISASRLRRFVVPLPTSEEQDEIIRCIDEVDRVRALPCLLSRVKRRGFHPARCVQVFGRKIPIRLGTGQQLATVAQTSIRGLFTARTCVVAGLPRT